MSHDAVTSGGLGALTPSGLLVLSSAEMARRVAAGLPSLDGDSNPARWVEALRGEAAQHCFTNAAQARKFARRAVELAELLDDPVAFGWGYRALAEASLFSGRMKEAEAAYAKAVASLSRSRSGAAFGLLGQLSVGRIHVLSLLGRHDEVEQIAKNARRWLQAAGDDAYLAKLSMNLGNAHFQRDEMAPALREYEQAATLFRALDIRDETVVGLETNRAVALTQLDRDDEALELFEQLSVECAQRGFHLIGAQVEMNAAYVHSQRAEFDRALALLARATAYFRETDHPAFLASCELNRAEIYHQLNLHVDAQGLADAAAPRFAAQGLRYDEAIASTQSALSHLAKGEIDDAVGRIRRARSLFVKERNASRTAVMELIWAEALVRNGRTLSAAKRVRHAVARFRALELVRWEATAAVLLTRIEAGTQSPARQANRLRRLLRRLPARLYPLPAYRLLEALGEVHLRAGNLRQAETSFHQALARLEDLRIRIPTEDSKIAFLGDKTELYDRLLRLELEKAKPSPQRLFEWMERSRAQSLWDRLRTPGEVFGNPAKSASSGRTDPRKHLAWLHARLSRLELGSAEERAQVPGLRRRLAQAEQDYSRYLRDQVEAEGPKTAASQSGNDRAHLVPAIDDVRAVLPDGWGFVSFHLGDRFAVALAITKAGTMWRRLSDDLSTRLSLLADRLDFQWGAAAMTSVRSATVTAPAPAAPRALPAPDSGPMRMLQASTDSVLREMHELLWAPLEELGLPPGNNWIISPHGAVHRIPIHALLGRNGYIVEASDTVVVPSARVWLSLPEPHRVARRAFVAGVPSRELPAVQAEVEHVGQILDDWRVTQDLTPSRGSLRSQGPQNELIHLAAHGSLRGDNPAYSFIELSDGPFFVHDLGSIQLPASTVILTACSSGRGANPAGDEWIGLARGFLSAGASTVVASLWPIQDQPTLDLMCGFYESYAAHVDTPRALGDAMRCCRVTHPHPWHWASFACLGGVAPNRGIQ